MSKDDFSWLVVEIGILTMAVLLLAIFIRLGHLITVCDNGFFCLK